MKFIMISSNPEHTKKVCEAHAAACNVLQESTINYDIIEIDDIIYDSIAITKMIKDVYNKFKESIYACTCTGDLCIYVVIESAVPAIMALATTTINGALIVNGIDCDDPDLSNFIAEHAVFVSIIYNETIIETF